MKFSRKAQLWLADKSPVFDRPSVYRRLPAQQPAAQLHGWDAMLAAFVGLVLLLIGMMGAVVSVGLIIFLIAFVAS